VQLQPQAAAIALQLTRPAESDALTRAQPGARSGPPGAARLPGPGHHQAFAQLFHLILNRQSRPVWRTLKRRGRSGRDMARGPDIRIWVPPPAWRRGRFGRP
jgi:hypothetical protein